MIDNFIAEICFMLNINKPSVSYDTSHFAADTMMAQCNSSGDTIYLKKKDKPNPDYLFAIAHELRHIWQISTNRKLYFSNYQTVDILGNEKYNSQLAEVDANAFAGLIMIEFFHLNPLWHGLSDNNIKLIEKRMELISQSF